MKTLYARDVLDHGVNLGVELQGWLKSRRRSGGILFLDVVDSTGKVQCVIEESKVVPEIFELAQRVSLESAIEVRGIVVSHANKMREIAVEGLSVIGEATLRISPQPRSDFDPFDPALTGHMLQNRHLYLRNPKIMAILKYRSFLLSEVRHWFESRQFTELDAPILTPVPLYDDRTAMPVTVDKENVFLTQCVGYYLEAAVHAFERVYNMGPSFRGEESRSPRHLMEYHHIKAEIAFGNLDDMIRMVEDLISHITRATMEKSPDTARILESTLCLDGLKTPFPRISYEEAITILNLHGVDFVFGQSLSGDEELLLSRLFNAPLWITGIPRAVEPFPYCIDPNDTRITRVADLIASNGKGELLGVAEKIHDLKTLDERLEEKGKLQDPRYEWIREVHQLGCVPHAAFGMGVERLIRWMLNAQHVRDAIPFPRVFRRRIYP